MEKEEQGGQNLPYNSASNTEEVEGEPLKSSGSHHSSFATQLNTKVFSKEKDGLQPLTVRFHPDTYEEVERIADEEGISLASAVRLICGIVIHDIENPGPLLREIIEELQQSESEEIQSAADNYSLEVFLHQHVNEEGGVVKE